MANVTVGYPAKAVGEFFWEHTEITTERGKPNYINGRRASAEHVRRLAEWRRGDVELAALAVVDRLLMKYDLAIWEYEAWATEKFGNDTFFDRREAVAALTA